MDETGSLTYEYLSLRTRNVSNFKYVHMLLKIVQHLMEPLVVGHLSSHVVTLSCHHVQDPKQVGEVRLVVGFFSGGTNSTGPGGQVPQIQNFGNAQVAMCLMIRSSYES